MFLSIVIFDALAKAVGVRRHIDLVAKPYVAASLTGRATRRAALNIGRCDHATATFNN